MDNLFRVMMVAVLMLAMGCMGGAQMVLKPPVQSKCEELKLRGCEQLAEGIVLYVDGDKNRGYSALRSGLARNTDEPLKLKAMATGLKLLQKAPGVGPYVASLRPIVELIDDTANQALLERKDREEDRQEQEASADKTGPKAEAKRPTATAETPEPKARRAGHSGVGAVRTGTLLVTRGSSAEPCNLLSSMQGLLPTTQAQCALAVTGPFVVTDLHASGGCSQDLVVLAGDPEQPAWFVYVPAGKPLALHGGHLAIAPDVPMLVAQVSSTAVVPSAQCAITWSGTRP